MPHTRDELVYIIAQQRLVIETPDGEQTERLLPSFTNFLSNEEKDNALLRFSGNHHFSSPKAPPVEEFTRPPFRYAVFETKEGKLIKMSNGKQHHHLLIPANLLHFSSDLKLLDARESPFLNSFLMIAFTLAA